MLKEAIGKLTAGQNLSQEETSAAMESSAETAARLERIAGELNTLVARFRC